MDRALAPAVIRLRALRRAGIAVAVAGGALAAIILLPRWLEPSVSRARVLTAPVDRGAIDAGFEASAVVATASEEVVSSPLETRVLAVLKRPGDAVRRGEPILALDTSAAAVEAERLARRGFRRREAEVAERKGEVALRQLGQTLEGARRTEAARRASLGLDIQMTEADLAQARRKLEQATTVAVCGRSLTAWDDRTYVSSVCCEGGRCRPTGSSSLTTSRLLGRF